MKGLKRQIVENSQQQQNSNCDFVGRLSFYTKYAVSMIDFCSYNKTDFGQSIGMIVLVIDST